MHVRMLGVQGCDYPDRQTQAGLSGGRDVFAHFGNGGSELLRGDKASGYQRQSSLRVGQPWLGRHSPLLPVRPQSQTGQILQGAR